MDNMVTLNSEVFEDMLRRVQWLAALEEAGVEAWSGYDSAYAYYYGSYGKDYKGRTVGAGND